MGKEQQIASEEIKYRLIRLSLFYLSKSTGRLHLYIQIEVSLLLEAHYIKFKMENKKLIAYTSKAARNYSITELEMCGLAINIAKFSHLLKNNGF